MNDYWLLLRVKAEDKFGQSLVRGTLWLAVISAIFGIALGAAMYPTIGPVVLIIATLIVVAAIVVIGFMWAMDWIGRNDD